jgi:WD40 repeat protein
MTDIFVSYSRKDSAVARRLFQAFKIIDLNPWVDWEDIPPAVNWLDQILQGIEKSDAFIFLVSPDSAISEVCKVEIMHAVKNNKRIIPILVRDVDSKTVIENIRNLNWIPIRETDDFSTGVEKVKLAITLDIEWVSAHRRLQVLALEWERRKDVSLLLRGGDLRNANKMTITEKKEPLLTDLQKTFITYSLQDERRKITLWATAAIAVVIMAVLSITAAYQARRANENALLAQENERQAQENAAIAIQNERIARGLQNLAENSENIAQAQRSAARAQIYQTRTGGVYTSTILAIDSLQRNPNSEAEQILRTNISLLPIPVSQMSQGDAIQTLALNPTDENTFLTASADGTICVWMLRSGEKKYCVTSMGSVEAAVYSPDGKYIASGSQSGEVLIINAETGTVETKLNYNTPIWDVDISPNGLTLAIARDDGIITVFNMPNREFNYDLFTFGAVYTLSFSPDGNWIGSGTSKGVTTLWNVSNGKILSGPQHQGEVLEVVFSPDSKYFVSGGTDSIANLTVTATGNTLFRIINEDWVEDIDFNYDGSWFVTVSDDARIRVWDTKTGKEKLRMLQDSFMSEVKVSPNGQWIATTGYDKTVRVWSAATGTEIFQIPLQGVGNNLNFSANGNFLVAGDQAGNINVWNIASLASATNYIQFTSLTQDVQFSPTGDWLAASTEGEIWLLKYEQLSNLKLTLNDKPIITPLGYPVDMQISPNANWLAVSTDAGEVILYDVTKKTSRDIASNLLEKEIVFQVDSEALISSDSEGNIESFDLQKQESKTLYQTDTKINSLANYSNILAIGLLDKIILFDLTTNTVATTLDTPGDHAQMTFSPDGTFLVASNSSGQLYIWKKRGNEYVILTTLTSELVTSLLFNPQAEQLLVGSLNNVFIVDPNTGKEIARIRYKDIVQGISFSADGANLATASLRALQFWDVEKIQLITNKELETAACTRLTQNLDRAQWAVFFGNEPYRKLCVDLP